MWLLNRKNKGTIIPATLLASALVGLLTITGLYMLPATDSVTRMTIEPHAKSILAGETFTIAVIVSATIPVNAFAGMVSFDENVLDVKQIDYNTSIADLWAKEPWFNRGQGTITFAGGSTKTGGFTDTGTLLSITFLAKKPGDAKVLLSNIQILKHDGLGTTANETTSIDTLFKVSTEMLPVTLPDKDIAANIAVIATQRSPDLNNDQVVNLSDLSIFMMYLATNDQRADFNNDTTVTTADLSVLLAARR